MPARLRLALFVTGLLAVTAIAGRAAVRVGERTVPAAAFAGAMRPPGIPPADFAARDEDGRPAAPVGHARQAGRRDVPLHDVPGHLPADAQQIRIALDDLGHDVPVVAVSVDPENDTPARAQAFLLEQGLQGRMRWALGGRAELQRLWRAYGIQPQSDDAEHTASTVLLDKRGVQRVGFAASVLTPDGLAHDIAHARARGSAPRASAAAPDGSAPVRPAAARSAAGARGPPERPSPRGGPSSPASRARRRRPAAARRTGG